MSLKSQYFAPLLVVVGASAWIAVAPIAAADPPLPQPGSESASATIRDIKAQGYNVQINWVGGSPDVSLSQCTVTGVNPVDASGAPGTLKTVIIAIECPNN